MSPSYWNRSRLNHTKLHHMIDVSTFYVLDLEHRCNTYLKITNQTIKDILALDISSSGFISFVHFDPTIFDYKNTKFYLLEDNDGFRNFFTSWFSVFRYSSLILDTKNSGLFWVFHIVTIVFVSVRLYR